MDYPQALVEKVARAIYAANLKPHGMEIEDGDDISAYNPDAVAALDALGLHEDRRTIVLAGNDTPVKAKPGKWLRYTTRWEPIRD